jgi:hypothetical protein
VPKDQGVLSILNLTLKLLSRRRDTRPIARTMKRRAPQLMLGVGWCLHLISSDILVDV